VARQGHPEPLHRALADVIRVRAHGRPPGVAPWKASAHRRHFGEDLADGHGGGRQTHGPGEPRQRRASSATMMSYIAWPQVFALRAAPGACGSRLMRRDTRASAFRCRAWLDSGTSSVKKECVGLPVVALEVHARDAATDAGDDGRHGVRLAVGNGVRRRRCPCSAAFRGAMRVSTRTLGSRSGAHLSARPTSSRRTPGLLVASRSAVTAVLSRKSAMCMISVDCLLKTRTGRFRFELGRTPIISRYLATVRRAISMPSFLRSSTRAWSLKGSLMILLLDEGLDLVLHRLAREVVAWDRSC
jgi:hypothetical protein